MTQEELKTISVDSVQKYKTNFKHKKYSPNFKLSSTYYMGLLSPKEKPAFPNCFLTHNSQSLFFCNNT
jgi:hypothetical protein